MMWDISNTGQCVVATDEESPIIGILQTPVVAGGAAKIFCQHGGITPVAVNEAVATDISWLAPTTGGYLELGDDGDRCCCYAIDTAGAQYDVVRAVWMGSQIVADMDRLGEIAGARNLRLIEDACHSWGSQWRGKGTGAIGDCGVFSFQASKNLSSAEGGIILTDDEDLAETCRSYTNCGRGKDRPWYQHFLLGGNLRMTEFQAALLLAQLARLDAIREILTGGGRTLAQGALAWIWARSEKTIPIPGFKSVTQVEENAGAMAFGPLDDSGMGEIEGLLGRE